MRQPRRHEPYGDFFRNPCSSANIMRTFSYCLTALLLCLSACYPPPPEPLASAPVTSAPDRRESPTFTQLGIASWYGRYHDGKVTANGERFDIHAMTAAHRTLAFGTIVRVINATTGQMVKVRINDRGPYERRRIIDLSAAAAAALGIHEVGVASVRVEVFIVDQPQS
jgi:rare lipoprotein A (peptidoglycan hydrolase)